MPAELSLYDLLGVDPKSDPNQIKAAYYAAIKTCHPDIDRSPRALDLALKLIDAYRVLGDPDRREMYNARFRLEVSLFGNIEEPPTARWPDGADSSPPAATWVATPPEVSVVAARVVPASPVDAETEPGAGLPAAASVAGKPPSWRSCAVRVAAGVASFAVGFAILLLAFAGVKTLAERRIAAGTALPAALAFVHPASIPNVPASPCFDLFSGLKGDSLYRECVRTRVKLHLRMMRLNPGAEMERVELQDAIAEIRQAVGAAQIKMSSTKGFIEESVATLAEIKNSARDQQVRRIAENYYYYYDCHALKHCVQ